MREVQVAEAALMEELSVLARAGQPDDDGGLTEAEDPRGRRRVQPFGQREIRIMATFWEGVFLSLLRYLAKK